MFGACSNKAFEIISLLDDLFLLETIGKAFLSFEDLHSVTLNECCRGQCLFDRFRKLAFQSLEDDANWLSILNQSADVLTQERVYLLKFGSDVFW